MKTIGRAVTGALLAVASASAVAAPLPHVCIGDLPLR
jgi:hypothetical protein